MFISLEAARLGAMEVGLTCGRFSTGMSAWNAMTPMDAGGDGWTAAKIISPGRASEELARRSASDADAIDGGAA